eukprot:3291610-Karenia_brevis.AAC.1
MRCQGRSLSLAVITFDAAISACEKGGQWQRVASMLDEIHGPGQVAVCDQLLCSHLSLQAG